MSLFGKLFGRSNKSTPADEAMSFQDATPCSTVEELLERYGGIALDKQLNFGDVIGNNSWDVDIAQGTISFGPHLTFPMQVLGTISHASQTWLWAWANTKSGLPEGIIQQSLLLKKYGEDHQIDLLRNDTFDFSKDQLHIVGLIASGMFHSSGYYIADYGQGAMVVTVKSNAVDRSVSEDQHKVLTVFPQLISQFDMNHKNALTHYLSAKGYVVTISENNLTGAKNGNTITAEFDRSSRLINING